MKLRTALVAGTIVALTLTGCSSDPVPQIADPPPTSATTAPPPSPTPVAVVESPEDFIKRWAQSNTDMQNSGVSQQYRTITVGCEPCDSLSDRVDSFYAAGGYIEFEGLHVGRIDGPKGSLGNFVFDVSVANGPTTYKRSADAEVESFAGGRSVYQMTLEHADEVWLVSDFVKLAR